MDVNAIEAQLMSRPAAPSEDLRAKVLGEVEATLEMDRPIPIWAWISAAAAVLIFGVSLLASIDTFTTASPLNDLDREQIAAAKTAMREALPEIDGRELDRRAALAVVAGKLPGKYDQTN